MVHELMQEMGLYICAIMDLFSQKIIGCKFSHSNNTHLLKMTFLQTSDASDLTYQELEGPKASAVAGFLRIFADSDFVSKLTHFRKRLQNKEKTSPSRIERLRSHYPFEMVGPRGFEPLTFCTPSKRATRLRYGPKNGDKYIISLQAGKA